MMKKILNAILTLILFVIKEVASFCIKMILLLFVLTIVFVGIMKYQAGKEEIRYSKDYTYIEIDMGMQFVETSPNLIKEILEPSLSYWNFNELLKEVEKDQEIEGLIFNVDGITLNLAQIEEVGKIIKRISKKKKIHMYSTSFDKNSYMFASYGTEIFMPPAESATSNLTGYNIEIPYYKRLLEKLLIDINVISIGEYKSFGENLTRNKMSQASEENTRTLLNGKYSLFLERVSKGRKIKIETLGLEIEKGNFALATPFYLKEKGIIDKCEYYYNFIKKIGKKNIVGIKEYEKKLLSRREMKLVNRENNLKKLGLIVLSGEINEDSILGKDEKKITVSNAIELFDIAFNDNSIEGIILRIDSPGGSALASELIQNMILTNKNKPVYVSIGSVAASGGYYIATAGDKIYLNKESVTGSIGVVSIIPDISKLLNKIGIDNTVLKNSELGDVYSLKQPMTEIRREKLIQSNLKVYEEFKSRVAVSRKLTIENVEKISKGRVYLGKEAVKIGLADGILDYEGVVKKLATDLSLQEYRVERIQRQNIGINVKNYLNVYPSFKLNENLEKFNKTLFLYNPKKLYF
jgi:protease-4